MSLESESTAFPNTEDLSRTGLHIMLDDMVVPERAFDDVTQGADMDWIPGANLASETFGLPLPELGKSLIAEALDEFLCDEELSDNDGQERSEDDKDNTERRG